MFQLKNEEQNGRRKVGWVLGRDGESNGSMRKLLFVVGEDKGCMLMGAKWELHSELNKNCFPSHVFSCISVLTEMQAVGWLIFSFFNEIDS